MRFGHIHIIFIFISYYFHIFWHIYFICFSYFREFLIEAFCVAHASYKIMGPQVESILSHFFIYSEIRRVKKTICIAGMFFDDFWIENEWFSNVPTFQKYSKCNGFREIPHFQCFHDLDGFRDHSGHHFAVFWRSQGSILMILGGIGDCLEFQWIPGSHQRHPESRHPSQGRVKVWFPGHTTTDSWVDTAYRIQHTAWNNAIQDQRM